jgi:hypothetical protein
MQLPVRVQFTDWFLRLNSLYFLLKHCMNVGVTILHFCPYYFSSISAHTRSHEPLLTELLFESPPYHNFAPSVLPSAFASSLIIRFNIFPLAVFGIESTNLTPPSSLLKLARFFFTKDLISSSVTAGW